MVDILVDDVIKTPLYTRISRMMRDISSNDITQGVKKTNLRQKVEEQAEQTAKSKSIEIQEIRHREITLGKTDVNKFEFKDFEYQTKTTTEHFMQFVTENNKILGFLRLSLGDGEAAMIREVHVYGQVANIGSAGTNAQHLGLGTKLLKKAKSISKEKGYKKINVISAIGTREYYAKRGFTEFSCNGLYQVCNL